MICINEDTGCVCDCSLCKLEQGIIMPVGFIPVTWACQY